MKVLVTGAGGLIGRHLLPRIVSSHDVYALTRHPPGEAESQGVTWVEHDLTRELSRTALPERIDSVVHLAQSQRYREFPEGAEDVFEVNVHSTFRLLEYARGAGAERFVLASTGGVYRPAPDPVSESAPLELAGPYFRSKRIAELLLDDYSGLLAGIALRFFFVYGPGAGQTLVPRLSELILAGEEISVQGKPGMRMNPLYVDDAAAAIEASLSLEKPAVVNVAGAETVNVSELAGLLGEALGREPRLSHAGSQPEDLVADIALMGDLLGVTGRTALRPGFAAVARALAASEQPGA